MLFRIKAAATDGTAALQKQGGGAIYKKQRHDNIDSLCMSGEIFTKNRTAESPDKGTGRANERQKDRETNECAGGVIDRQDIKRHCRYRIDVNFRIGKLQYHAG